MADYPLIDGHKHDFSSVEIQIGTGQDSPQIYTAITEISYNQSLTPGVLHGTAGQPLAFTQGKLEAGEGSFSMPLEDAHELITSLGDGYKTKAFSITCSYAADGSPTITDKLIACRITEDETTGSGDSEDPILINFSIMYLRGSRSGINPIPNMLQ